MKKNRFTYQIFCIKKCSGEILTLIKIVTRVLLHQKYLKRSTNLIYQMVHCGSKEKARSCLEFTLDLRPLFDIRNYQISLSLSSPLSPSESSFNPRSLSECSLNPRSHSGIRNCQTTLQVHPSGIIHPDIQVGHNHSTIRRPRPS